MRVAAGPSLLRLIYEAVPKKDGFDPALEGWPEPHAHPSPGLSDNSQAPAGQETVYKPRLCLVALAAGVALYLWGARCASVCICRGEGRQWGGGGLLEKMGCHRKSTVP